MLALVVIVPFYVFYYLALQAVATAAAIVCITLVTVFSVVVNVYFYETWNSTLTGFFVSTLSFY